MTSLQTNYNVEYPCVIWHAQIWGLYKDPEGETVFTTTNDKYLITGSEEEEVESLRLKVRELQETLKKGKPYDVL